MVQHGVHVDSAEHAVLELNQTKLDGRTVHIRVDRNYKQLCNEEKEEEDNLLSVFVGNIPWSLNNEDLVGYFSDFKHVTCSLQAPCCIDGHHG